MYYFYVLKNKNGKFYRGYSSDLKTIIQSHNSGSVTSTKNFKP